MPNAASGFYFEELSIGQVAESARTVTEADILMFGAASGDMNPVHFDAAFAATTRFEERIAHGMLTASHVSALIGMRLPGPGSVYVSQSLQFKRPVKIGATVTTRVEVTALDPAKGFVTLSTTCLIAGKAVLSGEAVVMVAKREG
ncbi:(R)-specific enoyl-CoA hydratase [Candidatus Phycosocius bacilliformis]|uniref:(R)-specific enoyl-CoA hydratase n=1 Tax=Candidatus Phycosocius bacilliformis TaxID=1445552 RepID=A0A2P2E9N1_9PROT|nr:MaoC family dehydratase [Candidatus Phycosocius bacilliformis]GBF57780.1 (R)-specific enoyl-CoA hydratase [Candidatus Phycosocius bacilliformis]